MQNFNWVLAERQRKASKKAPEKYQNLSEEEKSKKWKNGCEWYKRFSEEKEESR